MPTWRRTSSPAHAATQPTTPASHDRAAVRSRLGAAWVGVCIAAVVLVALVIFVAQNTAGVRISFLWLRGMVPLAVALLIAAASGAVVVVILAVARMLELRRVMRRQHHGPQ